MVGKNETKKAEFDKLRTPNYQKIYSTNAFVGCSKQDIRIELCNEKLRNEKLDRWGYLIDGMVIMSPVGAKKLLINLQKCIEEYEKNNGKIDTEVEENTITFI